MGPLFTPPIVPDTNGKRATLLLPAHVGGANWPGGAVDPETGMLYVASVTNIDSLALVEGRSEASDMGYVGGAAAAARLRCADCGQTAAGDQRTTTVSFASRPQDEHGPGRACRWSSRHGAASRPSI